VISCSGHSFQADIWSVGCCIIQMLAGKPPFSNMDNHMAVMFAVMKGQIEAQIPKEGISPELDDFLRKCLQTNPKDRPTTKQLLEHAWIAGVAESPTHVEPTAPTTGTVSPARRIHDAANAAAQMTPSEDAPPHRSQHQPNIMPRPHGPAHRTSTSGEEPHPSPPPSAGSRISTTPDSQGPSGRTSFVTRFPRHPSGEPHPPPVSTVHATAPRQASPHPENPNALPTLPSSAGSTGSAGRRSKSTTGAGATNRVAKRQPSTTVRR
jgi:serine/threonine protein kinase